jgi:hypothetical protein
MNAQDFALDDYVWKNRIVILISDEDNSAKVQNQISILLAEAEDLIERKMIVLEVKPEMYRLINPSQSANMEWISSDYVYKQINADSKSFEIQLIGLDGRVKMKSNEFVVLDELFALIDKMPMRQIELRSRNQ